MRFAVVGVVALAACFSSPPQQVAKPAVPVAPAPVKRTPQTVDEILEAMTTTYANATSYEDSGTVMRRIGADGELEKTLTFTTAFARKPLTLRFDFAHAMGRARPYTIWFDGEHAYTRWVLDPPRTEDLGDNFSLAIGGAAGISSATSYTVPPLLIASRGGSVASDTFTLDGAEPIDGHPCWRLRAEDEVLWIDRERFVIMQLSRVLHLDDGHGEVAVTATYHPVLNRPVELAKLAKPELTNVVVRKIPQDVWIGVLFKPDGHVESVLPKSPAEAAGIRAGDRITRVDGVDRADSQSIIAHVRTSKAGQTLKMTVERAGSTIEVPITVAKRPDGRDMVRDMLVGKPAPDFTAVAIAGPHSPKLADHAGAVVVVDFWATWCKPCAITMPKLAELHAKYPALRIIGITDEDAKTAGDFAAGKKLPYTIARDDGGKIASKYFLQGLPMLVVIDKTGIVRHVELGANTAGLEKIVVDLLAK